MSSSVAPIVCRACRSVASAEWSESGLAALAREGRDRNVAQGITARLFYRSGKFVHVVEGPGVQVARLFDAVSRDSRHGAIETLMECPLPNRIFSEWPLAVTNAGVFSDSQWSSVVTAIRRIPHHAADSRATLERLAARGKTTPSPHNATRVATQQDRSQRTVESIILAVKIILLRDGMAGLLLPVVAAEAGVSVPTLYRYFAGTDELLLACSQRLVMWRLEGYRALLASTKFESDAHLVKTIIAYGTARFGTYEGASPDLIKEMMPYIGRVVHEPVLLFAVDVRAAMRRCNLPSGRFVSEEALAIILTGLVNIGIMLARHNPRGLRERMFTGIVTNQFLSGLTAAGAMFGG